MWRQARLEGAIAFCLGASGGAIATLNTTSPRRLPGAFCCAGILTQYYARGSMATALITYRYLGQQRTSINLPPETEGGVSPVVDLIPYELVELPAGFDYADRGLRIGLLELVEPAEQTSKNRRTKSEEANA